MTRCIAFALLFLLAGPLNAQYFLDDFEDGSATDGMPVAWFPEVDPWPVGQQFVDAGTWVLTPAPVNWPNPDFYETDWEVQRDLPVNSIYRAQVRTLGGTVSAFHAIYARDTSRVIATEGFYTSVLLDTNGFMALVAGNNLSNTVLAQRTFGLRSRTQDINLELWLSGLFVDAFAWPVGTPRPAVPLLSGQSPPENLVSGRVGVAFAHRDNSPPFSGAFRHFEAMANCDFSRDWQCNIADLNDLLSEGPIAAGVTVTPGINDQFDLTGDGVLDNSDVDQWLASAASLNGLGSPYKRGDADLDGVVDGSDFGFWNANKFSSTLLWDDGNFNGDAVTDGADFDLWNANKFTSSDGANSVPEPLAGFSMLLWGAAILCRFRLTNRAIHARL